MLTSLESYQNESVHRPHEQFGSTNTIGPAGDREDSPKNYRNLDDSLANLHISKIPQQRMDFLESTDLEAGSSDDDLGEDRRLFGARLFHPC